MGLGWVKPDLPVSILGLAFLLFLAGLEIDVERLRERITAIGFAVSFAIAIALGLGPRQMGPRAPSSAPARATAKVLGIASFEDALAQARFNDLSHWGYGTGWGVLRGLLDAAGVPSGKATAAHGAAVWGSAQVTLPALDIAPPSIAWPKQEIAIDAFHHAVYATATGLAYRVLDSSRARN